MTREQLLERLKRLRAALAAEGVTHVAGFGSRARGDFRPDSDIDLLLDVDPDARFSILNLVGVEHIVGQATGLRANAIMRRSLDDGFKAMAGRDLVQVF